VARPGHYRTREAKQERKRLYSFPVDAENKAIIIRILYGEYVEKSRY
jgi:hypothetical protein